MVQLFLPLQLGTLGAGNHYAEIQVVDEIFNDHAAKKMGIEFKGQVCIMIHCGSRGLGHQVATGRELFEPCDKTCLQSFSRGQIQTSPHCHKKKLKS